MNSIQFYKVWEIRQINDKTSNNKYILHDLNDVLKDLMKQTPASTGTLVTIQHIIHVGVSFKFYYLLKEMADIHY